MYLIIYGYIFMQIVMKLQFIQNNTIVLWIKIKETIFIF